MFGLGTVKKLVVDYFLKGLVAPVVKFFEGKKTLLGLFQLVLGLALVIVQTVPELNFAGEYLLLLVSLFQDAGLNLADALLISGQGFTVVGLVDKLRRMFFGNKEEPYPDEPYDINQDLPPLKRR